MVVPYATTEDESGAGIGMAVRTASESCKSDQTGGKRNSSSDK